MRPLLIGSLCLLAAPAFAQLRGDALLDRIMSEQRLDQQRMAESMRQSTTVSGSSLSVRETADRYVIELSLQNRTTDDIEVVHDGPRLILSAPAVDGQPAYRQELDVSGALPDAEPEVKRQPGKLLVTLARDPAAPARAAVAGAAGPGLSDDALARLQQMQKQAEAMFQGLFEDNGGLFGGATPQPRSALQLEDKREAYLVTARVPEDIARDLDITVKDRRLVLQSQESAKSAPGIQADAGWSESVDLPGPVDAAGMTVEKVSDGLRIRLPKK